MKRELLDIVHKLMDCTENIPDMKNEYDELCKIADDLVTEIAADEYEAQRQMIKNSEMPEHFFNMYK